jgi:hypothetical protein
MGKGACGGVIAAAVVLLAGASAPAATGPGTIRITDVQTQLRHVDGGPKGVGPGDLETIQLRLYNPSLGSKPIGRGAMICTFIDSRLRDCSATFILPRGTIVAGGAISSRLIYDLAVLGGTGLYDNARGTLTVTATKFSPRREVLVFRLTG